MLCPDRLDSALFCITVLCLSLFTLLGNARNSDAFALVSGFLCVTVLFLAGLSVFRRIAGEMYVMITFVMISGSH
jgi:lipopolysaccharide export LptBFGC system permease protein LptF